MSDKEVTAFSTLPIDNNHKIPSNVIVPCPKNGTINKRQFNRHACTCCESCEYFRGLARLIWADTEQEENEIMVKLQSGELQWSDVFAIRCATIYEIPCQTIDNREY